MATPTLPGCFVPWPRKLPRSSALGRGCACFGRPSSQAVSPPTLANILSRTTTATAATATATAATATSIPVFTTNASSTTAAPCLPLLNYNSGCADALVQPQQARNARFWTADMIGYNHRSFMVRDDEAVDFFSARGIPVVDVRMLYSRVRTLHANFSQFFSFLTRAPPPAVLFPAFLPCACASICLNYPSLAVLQADAHHGSRTSKRPRDCLHYCLKSTALSDTFPRMLLHTLLRHGDGPHAADT